MKQLLVFSLSIFLLGISGCSAFLPPPVGLTDITARPGEKALLGALRAYEEARYPDSEKLLTTALQAGLVSSKDRAAAHKHLAFIYCTSRRMKECESAFRSARQADPTFTLSKAEAGHPLWGPVFKRLQL